jgi:hypothetical protein
MKRKVFIIAILEVLCFTVGTFAILSILTGSTNATNCTPTRSYFRTSEGACNFIYKAEQDTITYPGGAQWSDVVGGTGQCGYGLSSKSFTPQRIQFLPSSKH